MKNYKNKVSVYRGERKKRENEELSVEEEEEEGRQKFTKPN